MNDPQSLGDPAHIVRTLTGGSSWQLIEGSWNTDHCGALVIILSGHAYAIRNGAAGSAFYLDRADTFLNFIFTLPFDAPVAPHGFIVDFVNGDIFICSWWSRSGANKTMVAASAAPYTTIFDITANHNLTNGVEAIVIL